MKVQLFLSTLAILLLFTATFSLTRASSLRSKRSALQNLASGPENNGETTCSGDIEEILYFLKIGAEDIERTDVGDVVIVVGPSGVGKSTLTQFVANETNTLRAVCSDWGDCSIIDDSSTIGGDLISRTFLPNLVFHKSSNTPFYDMPGFNDNRNESMEIANSFFMQQILEEAESVKILVLARFGSFQNSAKSDFQNLLINLVDLIKSPAKFRGAMAIISTIAPHDLSHANIIGRNTQFLKESLLGSIGAIFEGQEKYIRGSTEIVENWLESDTENYFDAKYYSYFRSAGVPGHLVQDPLLYDNKNFLQEVIWDRLNFVPKEDGDFGLPMSASAKLKLIEVGSCISNTLATQMDKFADELEDYLKTNVTNLINGKEADIAHISGLLLNLTNSDFSFDNMEGQPLSTHLQTLLNEVNYLEIPSLHDTLQLIEDTLTFIQFIELANVEIQFDPRLWVIKMTPLSGNLIRFIDQNGLSTSSSLATQMDTFADDLDKYIKTHVANLIDGSETDIGHISNLVRNLTSSDFSFGNMEGQSLSTYLRKLLNEVNNIEIPSSGETRQQIENTLSFIQFIELVKIEIQFDPRLWVITMMPLKENLIIYFDSQMKEVFDYMIIWCTEEAKVITELILTPIELKNDIAEKENLVSLEVVRVRSSFEKINSAKQTKKLTEFLIFYEKEYDLLRGFPSNRTMPHLNALSVLEILDDFSWSNQDWTSSSIYTLQYPLEIERDLTIFLRALFKDLSQTIVQTGANSAIYTWWNSQTQLTEANFNDFHSRISIQGFSSPLLFVKSRVKDLIFHKTNGRKRLEYLLDFTLKNVYNCQNSAQIVVTGPIISLDRIISRCINQQQTTTSIVLLATSKMYANSKLIGRDINANNNINVILMSPELIVSNNSEIDLSGKEGQGQSNEGKSAGTQYLLFQNIHSVNDGSIPSRISFPNVAGGSGVDGTVGTTGVNNYNTGTNNFNVNSDDCAAWSSGNIQIRNYENDCNPYYCSSCDCFAGRGGRWVRIYGSSGGRGGDGGSGKDGSCGGAGGQSYSIDANYFQSQKTATNGLQGKNGVGGAGGPGGLGGPNGNTVDTIIYESGVFSRYCTNSNWESEPSSQRGSSGSYGSVGKSCTTQKTRNSVNTTTVNNHFASFKAALADLATNEFLYSQSTSLLNLLGNGQPLV